MIQDEKYNILCCCNYEGDHGDSLRLKLFGDRSLRIFPDYGEGRIKI